MMEKDKREVGEREIEGREGYLPRLVGKGGEIEWVNYVGPTPFYNLLTFGEKWSTVGQFFELSNNNLYYLSNLSLLLNVLYL